MRIKQSKEADWPTSPTGDSLAARDPVLKVACELFAEAGFHGTLVRVAVTSQDETAKFKRNLH